MPPQFSWVDHRLVRHRLLNELGTPGCALYLFLVSVGDEQGLSYYSDGSVCGHLGITAQTLRQARARLLSHDLIAWEAPLYQVLSLDAVARAQAAPAQAQAARVRPAQAALSEAQPDSAEEGRAESLRLAETLSQILKGGAL